jgi:competence protein ComEC
MVGGSATVVRSTAMSLIGIFARITGRTNSALVSLLVAGALMLIWNPLLLVYDPSFQLSFLASIGLILYSPRVEGVLKKVLSVFKSILQMQKDKQNYLESVFVEIVSSSLGTQVTTLPFILKMSGQVSIVSLPVNILLLPLIPYTMLSVFITGVIGFISSNVVIIPAYVSWAMLHFILETVHYFSSLHFAVYEFGLVNSKIFYVFYIFLVIEYALYLKKRKQVSQKETCLTKY